MRDRPNIIVITTHDTGRYFGCYGIATVHTPHIDALAAGGVRMSRCFAASPICCAARGSIMTGQYPQTNGQMDLCFPPFNYDLHDYRRHASHRLRDAGYRSVLFGVQHETAHADRLGFDERRPGARPGSSGPATAIEIAQDVAQFLRERSAGKSEALFAQVGFFETHSPFDWRGIEPDDSKGVTVPRHVRDNAAARRVMAQFQGAVRRVDDAIGIIERGLIDSGLADNTILVFTVDHGIEMPRAKWHLYDPGLEVALLIRWPAGGVSGGRTCDWLLSQVDLLPTLMHLAGLEIPREVEGRSFHAGLRNESDAAPINDAIFAMMNRSASRCVRTDRYKLIRNFHVGMAGIPGFYLQYSDESVNFAYPPGVGHRYNFAFAELYDLHDDPLEVNNLSGRPELAAVSTEIDDRLWRWMERVDDPLLKGPPRMPYYDQAIEPYNAWRQSGRGARA